MGYYDDVDQNHVTGEYKNPYTGKVINSSPLFPPKSGNKLTYSGTYGWGEEPIETSSSSFGGGSGTSSLDFESFIFAGIGIFLCVTFLFIICPPLQCIFMFFVDIIYDAIIDKLKNIFEFIMNSFFDTPFKRFAFCAYPIMILAEKVYKILRKILGK